MRLLHPKIVEFGLTGNFCKILKISGLFVQPKRLQFQAKIKRF